MEGRETGKGEGARKGGDGRGREHERKGDREEGESMEGRQGRGRVHERKGDREGGGTMGRKTGERRREHGGEEEREGWG